MPSPSPSFPFSQTTSVMPAEALQPPSSCLCPASVRWDQRRSTLVCSATCGKAQKYTCSTGSSHRSYWSSASRTRSSASSREISTTRVPREETNLGASCGRRQRLRSNHQKLPIATLRLSWRGETPSCSRFISFYGPTVSAIPQTVQMRFTRRLSKLHRC